MGEALVLSPEAPYPIAGGGPMRTASLLHYLASRGPVDLITFREPGAPNPQDAMPEGLVRDLAVINLPAHHKSTLAKAWRNGMRALKGIPPLVDRFAGYDLPVPARRYKVGVIEHFWCAPYEPVLRECCDRVVLNLHNVESTLLARSAAASRWPMSALLTFFAAACRGIEQRWLPRFDTILVCSDAERLTDRCVLYPNALPWRPLPALARERVIVFSGNLAYLPNETAVEWFASAVWPHVRRRLPDVRWKLVGKNEERLRQKLRAVAGIEFTGPVTDAVPHLGSAMAAVAPILSGSGTRLKILEAWAAGTPVVSTTLGAEGLAAKRDENILIADDPEAFADRLCEVLSVAELRAKLSKGGRVLYEKRYTWSAAWELLAGCDELSR